MEIIIKCQSQENMKDIALFLKVFLDMVPSSPAVNATMRGTEIFS